MSPSRCCGLARPAVLILRMHQSPLQRMMDERPQPLGGDPRLPALDLCSRKRCGKIELRQTPPSATARLIHICVVEKGFFRRGEGNAVPIVEASKKLDG